MDNFLGEIRAFPYGSIIPRGWALCDGKPLKIAQNQALYSLIGARFGGNATDFNVPNLNGRAIIGQGTLNQDTYNDGNIGGSETVVLTADNLPAHTHALTAANYYEVSAVNTNFLGNTNVTTLTPDKQNLGIVNIYKPNPTIKVNLHPNSVTAIGEGGAHENRQPYLALNYCIATQGVYPSRP